jgi:hypothetical protein
MIKSEMNITEIGSSMPSLSFDIKGRKITAAINGVKFGG